MEYLLAHDVGTSGAKAVLVTLDGRVVAKAFEPYRISYPRPLWAEQNPEDMWHAVAVTSRRVVEESGARPKEVLALAFSSQIINVILVDSAGRPLRPMISWLDGRAGAQAQRVMRMVGGPRVFAWLVGVALTGKDLLPKYLWLKRHEPETFHKAAAILDVNGYVFYRATGRFAYEWTAASVTGFFNLKTKSWDTRLMRLSGIEASKFPDLVGSCERVGGLTHDAAAELELLDGTPVFAGAGDAMAAAVGSGAVGEGEGHLCLGTSGFVGVVTSRRIVGRHGVATLQSADADKLLLIGESETCGACLKWAAQELYHYEATSEAFARMDADVASTAPGSGGMIFTPWMYGERAPVADERLRAAFINLSANHTRAQMTRAIFEGVAYNLRWILDVISRHYGFRLERLRVLGGGALGRPWLQVIADVTGRALECIPNPRQTSAVGAALLAAVGMGVYPSVQALKAVVPVAETVFPNQEFSATYDELYGVFQRLYRALRRIYRHLNESRGGMAGEANG